MTKPQPEPRGTHVLGGHAQLVADTGKTCGPGQHTPDQARALLNAILQCLDLIGGVTAAARPRAASPAHPAFANRTRDNERQAVPMNPVHRHYGGGASGKPPSDHDSSYWRHEYHRVDNHHDRCEVVRRAATYLAGLIARDPNARTGEYTDADRDEDIRIEGAGWPITDVAQKFHVEERRVVLARLDHDLHPLTGKPWTPPEHNVFAAQQAQDMRSHGLNSTDIARSLGRSASAVRMWLTKQRRAA